MSKRKKSSGPVSWKEELEHFFAGELAEKAGSFLSERAHIGLVVDGKRFTFRRRKGKNTITEGEGEAPDVTFWISGAALRHLLELARLPGTGMGTMGVAVIEHIFHSDESKKIKFRVDTGFLGLWSKGYFSVLKAGGPEVASYLSRWGFDSLSRIKDVLRKIKGA